MSNEQEIHDEELPEHLCKNCGNPLVEDEIDLCDECFATMPIGTWVSANKNNKIGEWK